MFEFLKDELDARELLEELGAKRLHESSRRITCMCLNPDHIDKNPSFHYRPDRHTFRCYSCGVQGDALDLIKLVKGCDFKEALRFLKRFIGVSADSSIDRLEAALDRRIEQQEVKDDRVTPFRLPAYHRFDFASAGSHIQDYVRKRRWPLALLAAHDVCYCEHGHFRDRIILPIKNGDGDVLSFAARSVVGAEPKYLYPMDTELGKMLWGIHDKWRTTPIFVEGIADALRLRQYGYNSYAILGNQVGEYKLEMIRKEFKEHKKIIVIPDNDKGGNVLITWFQKLVHDYEVHVGLIFEAKDVDDLRKPDIDRLIANTRLLTDWQIDYWWNKGAKKPGITTKVER